MGIEDGSGETLNVSESLDSDEVRNDDGDDVVDAPDEWSEADRFGTTLREAEQGESLDQRLAEEEPDIPPFGGDREYAEDDDELQGAEIVDGVIVEDIGLHRGQVDGDAAGGGPLQ
ncbi:hypothetical protein [Prescottella agglutinans]|uniref:Uncharacterized protein n=1 Tax=Prescottella agglutinans TaxID=1644129 RepID=A0ABT6MGN3_9NOCA|nr:hypothetical protein [Prescottella agglutinans]MDH6283481.1 hypothetical protein [Prescottella agglutinans]